MATNQKRRFGRCKGVSVVVVVTLRYITGMFSTVRRK